MVRHYLGIDVATSCGWACLRAAERGRIEKVGGGVVSLAREAHSEIDYLRGTWIYPASPVGMTVGLEDPYLGENPHALKVLARLVGRFEQAFEPYCPVVLVPAQTWQTAVLGKLGGRKRAERKKAALLWARAMFGRDLPEDEADATGLAYYLATKERA